MPFLFILSYFLHSILLGRETNRRARIRKAKGVRRVSCPERGGGQSRSADARGTPRGLIVLVFFLLIIHAIYAESLHTRSVPCPQQDEKQKAERARKQAETQAFIKNYLEDRKRWKEEQKRKQAEEMQIIDDWNRKIEARLDALKSQKAKVRAVLLCSFFLRSPDPCQPFRYQSVFVPFSPYLVHFLSQAASGHDALLAKISAEIEANRKQRYPNLFNCTVSPLPSQNNALTWLILFASSNSSGKRLSNCCWICFWKRKRPKRKKSKTCVRRNVMP